MSEHDKNLSRRKSPNHASFPRPNVLAVALLGGASAVAVRTCRTLKRLREGNKLSRVAPAPDSDFPTAPSRSLSSCMIIEPVDRADEALRLPKGETPMPLELRVWSCTVKYIVIHCTSDRGILKYSSCAGLEGLATQLQFRAGDRREQPASIGSH